jgi:hypothetical protein
VAWSLISGTSGQIGIDGNTVNAKDDHHVWRQLVSPRFIEGNFSPRFDGPELFSAKLRNHLSHV